jgi:hypothetical protein
MKPGDVIDVQLVDESMQPLSLPDVSLSIDFYLNGKYRYGFRIDGTDHNGRRQVTYEDVEQRRLQNLEAQPWDYKTRLEECDPLVRLSVPRPSELDEAVRTATSFNMGIVPPDAQQWARANNRFISCAAVEVTPAGRVVANLQCRRIAQ